jgi:hypothetical protein
MMKTNSKFQSLIEFPVDNQTFVKTIKAAECCHFVLKSINTLNARI